MGEFTSLDVLRPHRGAERPRRLGAEIGQAQAAFLFRLLPLHGNDFGICEHQALARLLSAGNINDAKPLRNANLRRGQAHAVRRVHGLEHVGDELFQIAVEHGDRLGEFFENLFAVFDNRINHFKTSGK